MNLALEQFKTTVDEEDEDEDEGFGMAVVDRVSPSTTKAMEVTISGPCGEKGVRFARSNGLDFFFCSFCLFLPLMVRVCCFQDTR